MLYNPFFLNNIFTDDSRPIHLSAQQDSLEVLKWYISHKQEYAYLQNKAGATPFFFAAQEGRLGVLEFLLKQTGVDPNAKAKDGSTALHWAAKNGQEKVVQYLIEQVRVNKNAKDNEGMSALTLALQYNHEKLVEMLIEYGASFKSVEFLYYAVLHPTYRNVERLKSFIEELEPDSIDKPHSHYGIFFFVFFFFIQAIQTIHF